MSTKTSAPRGSQVSGTTRRPVSGLPFAIICFLVFGLGLSGILVLNVTLQNQGFEVRAAQQQAKELGYEQESLESLVTKFRSPAQIADRARDLGMVPNAEPMFIKLPSGEVLGGTQAGSTVANQKGKR